MTSTSQKSHTAAGSGPEGRIRILPALLLTLFLWGAFFYDLLRQQLSLMIAKQTAMESMKILAVPGTAFLKGFGGVEVLLASLFYLVLMGLLIIVFLLLSLRFHSPLKRGIYLGAGLITLWGITVQDRMNLAFFLVSGLSFASFYLLTLRSRITFSLRDSLLVVCMMGLMSLSLLYGSERSFFLKFRDRVLLDTALGDRMVSFYYAYSPLAAGPVSQTRGIYQGVIHDEAVKDGNTYYLGEGLFMTGREEVRHVADYLVFKDGKSLSLVSRHGKRVTLKETTPAEILRATKGLFDMKGLLFLIRVALYFLPAGTLLLCVLTLRVFTKRRKPFLILCTALTLLLLSVIWYVTLTGNRPPHPVPGAPEGPPRGDLSLAYYLFEQKQIPGAYVPTLTEMTRSGSAAVRYWGANLMGRTGDKKDAEILLPLLEDPSPNVRYTACLSLYRLMKEGSYQHLLNRLLTDTSWYVRCRVYSVFLEAGVIPSPA